MWEISNEDLPSWRTVPDTFPILLLFSPNFNRYVLLLSRRLHLSKHFRSLAHHKYHHHQAYQYHRELSQRRFETRSCDPLSTSIQIVQSSKTFNGHRFWQKIHIIRETHTTRNIFQGHFPSTTLTVFM